MASARRWLPGAVVVCRRRAHECVQRRLQGRAAICIQLPVEAEDAVVGLAQIKEATLMSQVGVGKDAVGLEMVAQEQGRPLQAPGIKLLGGIDQDRLCL
jgi:hypothetical protein